MTEQARVRTAQKGSFVGSLMRTMSGVNRSLFAQLLGGAFGGKRDYYEVFGWDKAIPSQKMWTMYARGGIARRVVEAYPNAVWGQPPEFKATQGWEKAWEDLVESTTLWSTIHRWDKLSQLGRYSILLVGLDDSGRLETPVNGARGNKVIYLQPYSDVTAVITKWGEDPTNERFGLPLEYTIQPGMGSFEEQMGIASGGGVVKNRVNPRRGSYKVHWSRVVHIAQGSLENEVFGAPKLWAIWNYLTDLLKVVGGSAESYWLTANRGMHADIDKDLELEPEDEAALTEEIEEYQHGIRRFIRTRGVKVANLGSDVADPSGPYETLVDLISGTYGVPRRILLGSESGHNASTQDKGNWAERVEEYRALTAVPHILKPLLKGLMRMGVLPTVDPKKILYKWPDAYRLSPLEKSQASNQRATAAANITTAMTNVPNLLVVEEARELLLFERAIQPGTEAAEPKIANKPVQGDGGTRTPGNGDGSSSTPTSDANGKGAPVGKRK